MKSLTKALTRMRQTLGKIFGEAIAEKARDVNLVQGKQTWEQISEHNHNLAMMKECCASGMATYEATGLVPEPYYFHRVAVLSRKTRDYATEVAYCENYVAVVENYYRRNNISHTQGVKMGPRYQAIVQRLLKAKLLLVKTRTADGNTTS
jgi:hypothetical protein